MDCCTSSASRKTSQTGSLKGEELHFQETSLSIWPAIKTPSLLQKSIQDDDHNLAVYFGPSKEPSDALHNNHSTASLAAKVCLFSADLEGWDPDGWPHPRKPFVRFSAGRGDASQQSARRTESCWVGRAGVRFRGEQDMDSTGNSTGASAWGWCLSKGWCRTELWIDRRCPGVWWGVQIGFHSNGSKTRMMVPATVRGWRPESRGGFEVKPD